MIWRCGKYPFDSRTPVIMGILNVTPDSFSDGGSYADDDAAVEAAKKMVEEGALIIDVGGESTRPGASPVSIEEEKRRVLGVVERLASEGICVSIDTRHAEVAQAAVQAGASIINDVTGFRDPAMVEVAKGCDAGLVVMHMLGDDPRTMQNEPVYEDVVAEVVDYLAKRAAELEEAGIAHDRICLDPGPGFGKTADQTITLMRNFHELVHLGYPTMVAVSRKSYIGKAYKIDEPKERDSASAAEALMACELGASVIRTHNVALTAESLKENLRPYAFVALGCNLPLVADPGEELEGKKAMLNQAIADMCMLPDTQIADISSFYESEPAYEEDQDTFVNAVCILRTGLPPQELLRCLNIIENRLGRVREKKNGPRTCDLDILDYQGYVSELEVLTLPHPRLAERDFVVKPLLEIAPNHELANGTVVSLETVTVGEGLEVLEARPAALSPLKVQASSFWDVHAFGCVQSTNEVVKTALREGAAEGFCATALQQSGGYGRQGRTWVSPQGGLYTSFALRPNLPAMELPTLSLVVSLACADALEQACPGLHPLIKWPNDVLCEQGKLVGISLEALAGGVCVGVGMNLFQPQSTQSISGKYRQAYAFEGMAEPGLSADQRAKATKALELMLQEVERRYLVWRSEGFTAFFDEYSCRFAYRGKRATLNSVDGATCIEGTIEGVDSQGRILVNSNGTVVPMASGEVHITALG